MGTPSREKILEIRDFPAPMPPVMPTNRVFFLLIDQLERFRIEGDIPDVVRGFV
jgi:hypothetical protein